jgi:hypothetical protein
MRDRFERLLAETTDAVHGLLDHLRADPQLCGCDVDRHVDPTTDDQLEVVVLFAGVPADEVATHAAALRALGGDRAS